MTSNGTEVTDVSSDVYFVLIFSLDCQIKLSLCLSCHDFNLGTRYNGRLTGNSAKRVLLKFEGRQTSAISKFCS